MKKTSALHRSLFETHAFSATINALVGEIAVSSATPGIHAGNLYNKELVAGTTLFIPIHVRGALFQVGDGHAAQGNGEVCITALETSLTGRLQFIVRKDMKLR